MISFISDNWKLRLTRSSRLFCSVLLLAFINGCATQTSSIDVNWEQHKQRLLHLTDYRITGKLAYLSPVKKHNFNFIWTQSDEKSELRLTTVLGLTVLNLHSTDTETQIKTYDGNMFSGADPEALIQQLTGLDIPYEAMNHWIKGLPTIQDSYTLNEQSTLATIQNGETWSLSYQTYKDIEFDQGGTLIPLPNKLELTKENLRLKIVVSNWTITP